MNPDKRLLKSNGRVAHLSLKGVIQAEQFVESKPMSVASPVAALCSSPETRPQRERELVMNEVFEALEVGDIWVFGYAARDGFVGYMRRDDLADAGPIRATHVVSSRQSYLVPQPELKNSDEMTPISFGTALEVLGAREGGRWAEVRRWRNGRENGTGLQTCYVPARHLRPIGNTETDPVAVAERFLGVPYHWGGNSGFGLDCSGLVQAACLACGLPCPGDSDLQAAAIGQTLADAAPLIRGDLLFWKGHVAWVAGPDLLLHANAYHMAVAREPLGAAIERIDGQGDGPVIRRARIHIP